MSDEQAIVNIRQNEKLLKVIRQFPLVYFWKFALWFIIFLMPFFFIIPLKNFWDRNGLYIGLGVGLVAAVFLMRVIVEWYFTKLLITSRRIIGIHQKGLFDRTVSDTDFSRIIKISFSVEGIFETLFNYGNLEIETFAEKQFPVMKVGSPEKIYTFITNLQSESESDQEQAEKCEAWCKEHHSCNLEITASAIENKEV